MTLTFIEKTAGREFRDKARYALAAALLDCPGSAPCDPLARFYRHECPEQEGRTRSIQLSPVTITSPEIWVTWVKKPGEGQAEGSWTAISQEEAANLVSLGKAVEAEQVLAGKFSFTWKKGRCARCGMTVISREGILRDARPVRAEVQGDALVIVQQPGRHQVNRAVLRELEQ